MSASENSPAAPRPINSVELSAGATWTCRVAGVVLLGSGVVATFVVSAGAAPAAMILFGSLFIVLALMRRVPLSLEVAGAKFDASYEVDLAYDAGREVGRQQGVETALQDVEKAAETGESPHVVLERRRHEWQQWLATSTDLTAETGSSTPGSSALRNNSGFTGPDVCRLAGISDRQLDYWSRVGLVEPTVVSTDHARKQPLYSFRSALLLLVVKRLLDAGISLHQIRSVIVHLDNLDDVELERVTLISDGASIYEAHTDREVADLLASGQGIFGIALSGAAYGLRQTQTELGLRLRPGSP